MNRRQELLRQIPKVDKLLAAPAIRDISRLYPKSLILKAINQVLEDLRRRIRDDEHSLDESQLGEESVSERVLGLLPSLSKPSLRPVINATGVVVHTNLGRSILAEEALEAFRPLAGGYSNLEYDLEDGKRGSRYVHVEGILKELTSAEGALVVNNNAAAVLLSLQTLAQGREVIVSRGELVEIGGSFRIPEVMRKSGARMVEVGTTNKTHLRDYEEAVGPDTGLLLKVHRSNFEIVGFTEQPALSDLVSLGRRYGLPVMEDLGSGCFVDLSNYGLLKEPTVKEVLARGVDVVTFSGDKLLGGPQAGIILGKKGIIERIKKNQLNRALRIDKLTLLALEKTLRLYRDEEVAVKEIPTLRMICEPYDTVVERTRRLLTMVGELDNGNFSIQDLDGTSKIGGGALPLLEIPSRVLCLEPERLSSLFLERWFREYDPPIIGRLEKDRFVLDIRTVQEGELDTLARAVKEASALS